jgi:ABC-type dipeptide/oligopeptide/nickel transport system permease subunit
MARIVRGQVLSIRQREYVLAARTMGASGPRIIFRHVLPNCLGPIIVYATLTVPSVILLESFLSFLGLGVKLSWGILVAEAVGVVNPIQSDWWLLAFPSAFLMLTLLSLNFLGDGLRDALDPKTRR